MTSQQKKMTAGIVLALLVAMFATNPDQATHMRAIRDTATVKPGQYSSAVDMAASISYNNYFVFSTTTILDAVVSWGVFGKVNTTNRVSDPLSIQKIK